MPGGDVLRPSSSSPGSRQLRWPGSRPGAAAPAGARARSASALSTQYLHLPVKSKEEVLQELVAKLQAQMVADAERYLQVVLKHKEESSALMSSAAEATAKLRACEASLERERARCVQLARDNADFQREERFHIQFVRSFLQDLGDVRRELVEEIHAQRSAYSRLAKLHLEHAHSKELFVLGEKTALRLQHENEFLRHEIRQLRAPSTAATPMYSFDMRGESHSSEEPSTRDEQLEAQLAAQISELEDQVSRLRDSEMRARTALEAQKKKSEKKEKMWSALQKALTDDTNSHVKVAQLEQDGLESRINTHAKAQAATRWRNESRAGAGAKIGIFGAFLHFEMGLDRYYGKAPAGDDGHLFIAMEQEFKGRPRNVKTTNYGGIESDLVTEWDFVVQPENIRNELANNAKLNSSGADPFTKIPYPKRQSKPLEFFLRHPTAIHAKLSKAEVIGLRLYTGPAYQVLNMALRNTLTKHKYEQDTMDGRGQQGEFRATIGAINSGLKKLARDTPLSHDRILYRGFGGLAFESTILVGGKGRDLSEPCFVEPGFSSATPNLEVALQYVGQKHSSLLEIVTGGIDRGAHLSWLSQFPLEDEHTVLPLSAFEVVHQRTVSRKVLHLEAQLQKQKRILLILLKLKDCSELRAVFETLDLMEILFEEVAQDDEMVTVKDFTEHFKTVPEHSAKKHAHQHGNAIAHGRGHNKTLVHTPEGQHANDHAKAELRALIPEAIVLFEQSFAQSDEHPQHREKISKKEFIDVCIRHGSAAASWKDSLHHSGATKVFSLVHELSSGAPKMGESEGEHAPRDVQEEGKEARGDNLHRLSKSSSLRAPPTDTDEDPGTDLKREHLRHLLEHFNVGLSDVEVDEAFAHIASIDCSQSDAVHLFDLWRAVQKDSLDELRAQIRENRIKQLQEEVSSRQHAEACEGDIGDDDDDFVNVFRVHLNINLKAQTSQERLESRRTWVWDLYQNLRTEAANETSIGEDVVHELDEVWRTQWDRVPALDFLEFATFKPAVESLLKSWHEVLKREKLSAHKMLQAALEGLDVRSLDKESKILIAELGEKAALLMTMCESTDDEDGKNFWPAVEDAFQQFNVLQVRMHGARGFVDTLSFAMDHGLRHNKVRNARRVADHLVEAACSKKSCLPFVLSADEIQRVKEIVGEDAAMKLETAQGGEVDLISITEYMRDHIHLEDAKMQALAIFKTLQTKDHVYDTATRTELEKAGAAKTVIDAMNSNSLDVTQSCLSVLLGLIESRPKGGEVKDVIMSQVQGQLAAVVQTLERCMENVQVVQDILWIFTHMAAVDRSGALKILKKEKAADIIQKAAEIHGSHAEIHVSAHSLIQQLVNPALL